MLINSIEFINVYIKMALIIFNKYRIKTHATRVNTFYTTISTMTNLII